MEFHNDFNLKNKKTYMFCNNRIRYLIIKITQKNFNELN